MIKNYFYLLRHVIELNKILSDSSVNEFYSQEKDNLNICIGSKQHPHRHLIISADQNFPYILVKNDLRKAKKNTINFWDEYLPDNLLNIKIALNERVIKFNFSKFNLYLIIRGNITNIILINNFNEIYSFKKSKQDDAFLKNLIDGLTFVSLPEKIFDELEKIDLCDYPTFRKSHPHIGREIYEEAILQIENNSILSFGKSLKFASEKILEDKIAVHYLKNTGQINLVPQSFSRFKDISTNNIFNDFNSAIKFYISEYFQNFEYNKLSKELNSYFEKELHKLSEKINKLKFRIDTGSKENEYRKLGNLLLANIYKISKGQQFIYAADYESGEEIKIKLKETNSPNQNVNLYFDKAKDEKINFAVSYELYKQSIDKHAVLLEQQSILNISTTIKELREIKNRLKIGTVRKIKKDTKLDIKYKHYRIENKFDVYVGKDSKSNDLLTTRFAKQNDYWFHARGLPGSHVILRSDNPKEIIPKPVLKKAAAIAAFHSKAKTAGIVPVSYTFAKFVYKKKGLEPGQVFLTKENVLTVQPEIPADCELINE